MTRFLVFALVAVAGVANAQILNGGFETGNLNNWTVYAAQPSPVVDGVTPHSGSFSAFLGSAAGGETPGDSAMFQAFAVGAGGGSLTFYTLKSTVDSITFDWQDAYIRNSSGVNLATIFHTCTTAGWALTTVDMSPYAGTTVQIAFLVHGDNAGDPTSMRVDDVLFTPVPEPASMAVLGVGALVLLRRRKKA
jgi:hypothetical protein